MTIHDKTCDAGNVSRDAAALAYANDVHLGVHQRPRFHCDFHVYRCCIIANHDRDVAYASWGVRLHLPQLIEAERACADGQGQSEAVHVLGSVDFHHVDVDFWQAVLYQVDNILQEDLVGFWNMCHCVLWNAPSHDMSDRMSKRVFCCHAELHDVF